LIADIEMLRVMLGVDRWTVLGLSWGTTLGLAYAEAHPHRVKALVLGFVTTTSRREVQWITKDVGRIFPREWDRFASAVPDHLRHLSLVDAYAAMLSDADPVVRDQAASEWCAWEDAHVSLTPGHVPNPRFQDPEFRLRFARLVTHYWRHAAFLEEDQLIRDAPPGLFQPPDGGQVRARGQRWRNPDPDRPHGGEPEGPEGRPSDRSCCLPR
jgi:proline iminopeptidase